MKELEQYFNKFRILITSYSYEDASGMNKDNQKFISRGGRIINDLFRIIWITKINGLNQKILIRDGENGFIAKNLAKEINTEHVFVSLLKDNNLNKKFQ